MSIRKLEAPDGYVYTRGEFWGKTVYLGIHDAPEAWTLTPESELELVPAEEALEELEEVLT